MTQNKERKIRERELQHRIEVLKALQETIRSRAQAELLEIDRQIEVLGSIAERMGHAHKTPTESPGYHSTGAGTSAGANALVKGRDTEFVLADRAREHLQKLMAAGLSLRLISSKSKVSIFNLYCIATTQRKNIRARLEKTILAWTPEMLAEEKHRRG